MIARIVPQETSSKANFQIFTEPKPEGQHFLLITTTSSIHSDNAKTQAMQKLRQCINSGNEKTQAMKKLRQCKNLGNAETQAMQKLRLLRKKSSN